MFKGFKLNTIDFIRDIEYYYNEGNKLYDNQKQQVKESLESFFLTNKVLDGNKIINSWFPEVKCHIFLSHSHKNQKEVIALAGWLKEKFELDCFIDSCVWGYGDDLINSLDNVYSWMDKKLGIYEYKKVLFSSAHVHSMLSTALNSMINNTECLIFYNTPESMQQFKNASRTESPWIYSEISFAEMVRKKTPRRLLFFRMKHELIKGFEAFTESREDLKVSYEFNHDHLDQLDVDTFKKLLEYENSCKGEAALDKLYFITQTIVEQNLSL